MKTESKSPDTVGIEVSVSIWENGVKSKPVSIGHLESISGVDSSSRSVKKYTPLNTKTYAEIVSTGSITKEPFSMSVLFDPSAKEGINLLKEEYKENRDIEIIVEFNDSKGANGTKYAQKCKVSDFKQEPEADGKLKADFTAQKIGEAVETPAA